MHGSKMSYIDENFKNAAETLKKHHQEPVEFYVKKGELHTCSPGRSQLHVNLKATNRFSVIYLWENSHWFDMKSAQGEEALFYDYQTGKFILYPSNKESKQTQRLDRNNGLDSGVGISRHC